MKVATEKLFQAIENAHDWEQGQTRSEGGTRLRRTDTCLVCSLRRHWFSDEQNGILDQTRFSDGETGEDLSLRQAVTRGCAEADGGMKA